MRLALLALLLLSSPVQAQVAKPETTVPIGMVSVIVGEDWMGYTVCGTRPSAWLNITPGVVPDSLIPMVIAHELEHVRQAASAPSCAAYVLEATIFPERKLEREARAFCVAGRHQLNAGHAPTLMEAIWVQASYFQWYKHGWSQQEAAALIWSHCIGGA